MAGITLAIAEAKLALWLEADEAVAAGQEYSIQTANGSRRLVRADAEEIRRHVDYWNGWVQRLANGGNGGMRMRGATPV